MKKNMKLKSGKVKCFDCLFCEMCVSDLTVLLDDCLSGEDMDMWVDLFDDKKEVYLWSEMSYNRYKNVTSWDDRNMPTEFEMYEMELMELGR